MLAIIISEHLIKIFFKWAGFEAIKYIVVVLVHRSIVSSQRMSEQEDTKLSDVLQRMLTKFGERSFITQTNRHVVLIFIIIINGNHGVDP